MVSPQAQLKADAATRRAVYSRLACEIPKHRLEPSLNVVVEEQDNYDDGTAGLDKARMSSSDFGLAQ